ncbi:hypothetical protein [Polaromonas sp. CG_9.11]|uniref:hypothetical protein n=1 Tax=Polaromonas sp. CG_9.11 TaxID=2787730 RepID=UPI001A22828B|nr:hypothetical protein [Polaromonas sp. CG_9.11]MBG6075559.1 hypothetical protein [Polaromonas sp. CG_9.11]
MAALLAQFRVFPGDAKVRQAVQEAEKRVFDIPKIAQAGPIPPCSISIRPV